MHYFLCNKSDFKLL